MTEEDEAVQLAHDLKVAKYADAMIRRDRDSILYGLGDSPLDMTPDGRNIADTYRRLPKEKP